MVVHKHTKLTPRQRRALAHDHFVGHMRKVELMAKYGISFPTVQKILERARHGDFTVHRSVNKCRGNVLRSLIAETYLRSLRLPNITATSIGTNVDLSSKEERMFFADTIALFKRHGLEQYAKDTSDQLTQERAHDQDITICMNSRVVDEARKIVALPENALNWDIVDIGEGHRITSKDVRLYEEQIFQEIVTHVDELVSELGLQK